MMNEMMVYVIGTLLFAGVFVLLISWGIIKENRKEKELLANLFNNCQRKIMKQFETHQVLSKTDLINIIRGTKAGLFWSRKKLQVTQPEKIIDAIVADMVGKEFIVEEKKNYYRKK